MNTETLPVKRETISELEARYKSALNHLNRAGAEVAAALKEMPKPKYGKGFGDLRASALQDPRSIQQISNNFKTDAWRHVFDTTEITRFMAAADIQKMNDQLDKGKELPDFTTENVLSVMTANLGNLDEYIMKLGKAVFETLTPWRGYSDAYKTNHNPGIGKKFIWRYMIDTWSGKRISYRQAENFNEVQKLFLLLDGKPSTDYTWSRAADAVIEKGEIYENEYLQLKAFKNGNGHLLFKRMDLIEKINAMATDNALPYDRKRSAA